MKAFGIEQMKNNTLQKIPSIIYPMCIVSVTTFTGWIDKDLSNKLQIIHFVRCTDANLIKRVIMAALAASGFKHKNIITKLMFPETCSKLPVLAFDISNNGRAFPGKQSRDNMTYAFTGTGRSADKNMCL